MQLMPELISECCLSEHLKRQFFTCLKTLFLGYANVKRTFQFIILQSLWEHYFWMFSEHFKTSNNI